MNNQILLFLLFALAASSIPPALGHGLGLDTIPSIVIGDQEISVNVEIPSYYDKIDERQVTISAVDKQSGQGIPNVTYEVGLFHDGYMLLRDRFFSADGVVSMNVQYSGEDMINIRGNQDPDSGAWHATLEQPVTIIGPVFESGGLYTFEIELLTINEPDNLVADSGVYTADLTIVEVDEFFQKDAQDADVKFRTKSYFDSIDFLDYDSATRQVALAMPFDWSEKKISHIPVVHVEVHLPKDFEEFLTPGYTGQVNDIDLFKSSISVDDYTEDDERIIHFVLLKEHIRHIKNQLKQADTPVGDTMFFTLQTAKEVNFPVSAWTRDESYQVDLSWDPVEILPDQKTKFVFTIRDASTAEPLRDSSFDFVILQDGKEIHRESGNARVGGDFVDYEFLEDQTGPTIIRFENIRQSGQDTEFGIVVAPEFGIIASLILASGISSAILLGRKFSLSRC